MLHTFKGNVTVFGENAGQQSVAMSLCVLIYSKIAKITSVDDLSQIYDCWYSIIAELWRAKRASGAPWVIKFGYDVAYARTLFAGEGRESGVSPSGGGVYYKPRDAFVQPTCFLEGSRARNDVAVVAFKNMFTSTELLHCIRILCPESSVSSKLFRRNCYGNKQ